MSEDLRNSLKLWAGSIAFIGISWVVLRSNLLGDVPTEWFWIGIGVAAIWNLGQFGWGLWQRRASKLG